MLSHGAPGPGRTDTRRRAAAGASGRRLAWGTLLATSLAVCVVPVGCGASDEYPASPQHETQTALSRSTVAALQACADEGAGRLERKAYQIRFEVTLDDDGAVRRVTPTGRRLDDARLEGCMVDALRELPAEFMPENASSPLISHSLPVHARGALGSITVLPELIELVPVVVTGSGVTIVVVVAVVVVVAAVALTDRDPTEEECEEERIWALKECRKWLAMQNPPRDRIGPSMTLEECILSNIHEACGGKKVDREKSPRYDRPGPGKRF